MGRIGVAILGATGTVGQEFIKLLLNHPWFEIRALTASPASAGKPYHKVARWHLEMDIPEELRDMTVLPTDPQALKEEEPEVSLVFSALPSEIAKEAEPKFAEAGYVVCSNASAYRMHEDIPLVIPEVNPDHLKLIEVQRKKRGWSGAIVTNPNCTTIVLVLSLKPLVDEFGVRRLFVSTMQAISGAGYEGLPSMAMIDNVIPFIEREEEKVETETLKILGKLVGESVVPASIGVSASCNRVHVLHGHTETVFVELEKEASPEEVAEVMDRFTGEPQRLELPTAPKKPIHVRPEANRPQPRFDRDAEGGMAVVVGRIRKDPILENGIKYVVTGHNLIRGAAGASVLNAELMVAHEYL